MDGCSIYATVNRALQIAGIQVGNVTKARDVGTVAGLVSSNLGISAVPSLVLPMMQFCKYSQKRLVGPTVERDIYLIYDPQTPLPPAAHFLMEMLRNGAMYEFEVPQGVRWIEATAPIGGRVPKPIKDQS